MISFACKKIDIKDIIKCSFDLNKTDYNILMFLIRQKEYLSTNDVAGMMDLDRTSIQKSIKRLTQKSLVVRSQQNLEGGGYMFSYRIKDKDQIKKQILEMVSSWNRMVRGEVEGW